MYICLVIDKYYLYLVRFKTQINNGRFYYTDKKRTKTSNEKIYLTLKMSDTAFVSKYCPKNDFNVQNFQNLFQIWRSIHEIRCHGYVTFTTTELYFTTGVILVRLNIEVT